MRCRVLLAVESRNQDYVELALPRICHQAIREPICHGRFSYSRRNRVDETDLEFIEQALESNDDG